MNNFLRKDLYATSSITNEVQTKQNIFKDVIILSVLGTYCKTGSSVTKQDNSEELFGRQEILFKPNNVRCSDRLDHIIIREIYKKKKCGINETSECDIL